MEAVLLKDTGYMPILYIHSTIGSSRQEACYQTWDIPTFYVNDSDDSKSTEVNDNENEEKSADDNDDNYENDENSLLIISSAEKVMGDPSAIEDDNKSVNESSLEERNQKKESMKKEIVYATADSQTRKHGCSSQYTQLSSKHTSSKECSASAALLYDEMQDLDLNQSNYLDIPLIINRLLGSNTIKLLDYYLRQPLDQNPFSENVKFTYDLDIVSKFAFDNKDKHLTCFAASAFNYFIFALGFRNKDNSGSVGVWNAKNMIHFERYYEGFASPVSSILFFTSFKLLLGFDYGTIIIIDITSLQKKILLECNLQFDKITCTTCWKSPENSHGNLVVATSSGTIYMIENDNLLSYAKQIGSIFYLDKSLDLSVFPDVGLTVPLTSGPAVCCMLQHPENNELYLVGCSDGYLRLCSTLSVSQNIVRHNYYGHFGGVEAIKPSLLYPQMFMTCGYDGLIKIWAWGTYEPILVLDTDLENVRLSDVAWSPRNATVIAAIADTRILIWDILRKTFQPMFMRDTNSSLVNIEFSKSGDYLLVASKYDGILIMKMNGMPFPECNKKIALNNALLHTPEQFLVKITGLNLDSL